MCFKSFQAKLLDQVGTYYLTLAQNANTIGFLETSAISL